jgi:predicted lipid-binding transport protein (Tim44 family)
VTPDSGLSSGAKAGIGVGIGLFACLVIAGLLWFCMRRRKAARQAQTSSQQSESVSGGPSRGMSQTPRNRRSPGVSDYFGPAAVAGPYTDHESPGNTRFTGVPVSPDNPNDIVPAVEIGNSKEHSNVTSPGEITDGSPGYIHSDPETTEFRAELPE